MKPLLWLFAVGLLLLAGYGVWWLAKDFTDSAARDMGASDVRT